MIPDIGIHFHNNWSGWAILLGALVLSLVCLFWVRRALGVVRKRWVWTFFVLRWLALLMVVAFLVNPVLSYRSFRSRRGGVAILVDTSRSMETRDSLGGASRFAAAKAFLFGDQRRFFERLTENYDPHLFVFDVAPAETRSDKFRQLDEPRGDGTMLASAIKGVSRRQSQLNLMGLVLLSDGQDNGREDPVEAARQSALPVYAVGVGKQTAPKRFQDRRLVAVKTNPIAVRNAESVARVTLEHEGFAGEVIDVRLMDGELVMATERVALGDETTKEVRLTFRPTEKGQRTYRVSLPNDPRDETKDNDALEFSVLVSDSKIRLLYVEGRLRWEYKFFKRFLEQDAAVEPGFIIHTGGANVSMQSERPIPLDGNLPGPMDELRKFDVIVLGDIPKDFFSDAAVRRLEQYVADEGGSVFFIAGYHTMLSGEYRRTPMETLLPVQMKALRTPPEATPATILVSSLGRGHDILTGLASLLDNRRVSNAVAMGAPKPGAMTLLEQRPVDGGAKSPLLVAQTTGEGRTAALATDRLYEWDFGDVGGRKGDEGGTSAAQRLWGQLTRWLARQDIEGEKEGPLFAAYTDQTYYQPNERVTINAQINPKAVGANKLVLDATVYRGERKVAVTPMSPTADGQRFRGAMTPPGDGFYRVELKGTAGDRTTAAELKFNVGAPSREMQNTRLNEGLLRSLAQQTNGGYYSLLEAEDILTRIRNQTMQVEQRKEQPLVDSPWAFGVFLMLAFAEWTLRRRKQLI